MQLRRKELESKRFPGIQTTNNNIALNHHNKQEKYKNQPYDVKCSRACDVRQVKLLTVLY